MEDYEKYLQVFSECGWKVNVMSNELEIESWSPAGEDLVEYLRKDIDIPTQWSEIAFNFNADEHAERLIPSRGSNGVPSSISELVQDALMIEGMYSELAAKLWERQKEIKYDEDVNRCVSCGNIIPEGRQVCPNCEDGYQADVSKVVLKAFGELKQQLYGVCVKRGVKDEINEDMDSDKVFAIIEKMEDSYKGKING